MLLGTGDREAEEVEGLLLDRGRAGEDGEGAVGRVRGHDGVAREGGEIGEQGLEAVDRGAVGRAAGGALGERCALATGLSRRASAASLSSSS